MTVGDYVNYGGSQMLQQPYLANNVSYFGFVVPGDLKALQNVCDNRFNKPSGGAVSFEPAGPFVVMAFNKLTHLSSQNPPDSLKGFFTEQEAATWMLVIDRKRERQFWFQPYIMVDSSYAMALGREVYGFPKSIAQFVIPDGPDNATELSATTLAIRNYSPTSKGEWTKLIEVKQTAPPASGPAYSSFGDIIEFLREVGGVLEPQGSIGGDIELALHTLDDLLHRRAPMAFLKQFPDVTVPGKACYQSIVECDSAMTAFHSGAILHSTFQVNITPCDSHPIVKDLGFAGQSVTPILSYFVDFDFEIGVGTEIWNAQGGK